MIDKLKSSIKPQTPKSNEDSKRPQKKVKFSDFYTSSSNISMTELNLPDISDEQLEKGVKNLKQMTNNDIIRMATALKTMDPRLVESVFKSQGINMTADDIEKMSEALTPENIEIMTNSIESQRSRQKKYDKLFEPEKESVAINPKMKKLLSKELGKTQEEINSILPILEKLVSSFS